MPPANDYTPKALEHIRHLSATLGGRGSCTPIEREAAEYVAGEMRALDVEAVQIETYQGAPSTYRPYALALAGAMLGTGAVWLAGGWPAMAVAAILNALGAWGMLAETDFAGNWMRLLLPKAGSQNAVGVVRPTHKVRRRVVLCAHLDTHRTPIFYSSKAWHMLFGVLVAGAFLSMVAAALFYALGAALGWDMVRWIGLLATVLQVFAFILCIHADFTPFSPGANDNASGIGVILGLVERLAAEPLTQTEVWLAFTGCEEASAYGMAAFLDAHAAELGDDAVYVILDQVGLGEVMYLTSDGLIRKRKTHPLALDLARRADSALPELKVAEQVGIAYTDAAVATKRGLIALTVDALLPPGAQGDMHWHQMSDTLDHIDPQSLAGAHAFTWQVLQEVDLL